MQIEITQAMIDSSIDRLVGAYLSSTQYDWKASVQREYQKSYLAGYAYAGAEIKDEIKNEIKADADKKINEYFDGLIKGKLKDMWRYKINDMVRNSLDKELERMKSNLIIGFTDELSDREHEMNEIAHDMAQSAYEQGASQNS